MWKGSHAFKKKKEKEKETEAPFTVFISVENFVFFLWLPVCVISQREIIRETHFYFFSLLLNFIYSF